MIANIVRIADGIVFKQVGDEMVLLDFERGIYFGLDPIGARIWQLITEEKSVAAIVDALADEYDVARDELERDVAELLDDLAARGLI
ncbi:MAG TPA: PqqD family protein, partial [Thermoanaerobaculia bacterium]|nr:PqqD family protein [Thermoanaerobaculia bacterium]